MNVVLCGSAFVLAGAVMAWPQRASLLRNSPGRDLPHTDRPRSFDAVTETLDALDATIALLRAGTPAAHALVLALHDLVKASAGRDGWSSLSSAAQADEDVAVLWEELAQEWDAPALRDVATAWRLSTRHGCPLADALAAAVDGIRAQRDHEAAVRSSIAGAQATLGVLILLPFLGIALGLLLGVDMFGIYLSPAGLLTLWPALALMWLGHKWAQRLVTGALEPEVGSP